MASTFSSEIEVGKTTYSLRVTVDDSDELVLDLLGADADGTVVADGRIRLPVVAGASMSKLIGRVVDAHSRLHKPRRDTTKTGAPWTDELDEVLRTAWLEKVTTDDTVQRIREIGVSMQRSPLAIRTRLARVGCDPDVVGRALSPAARQILQVKP